MIGNAWLTDLSQLQKLRPYADDKAFCAHWRTIKQQAKQNLVDFKTLGLDINLNINVNALFDVQVKRIHEYKRQLLNVLHVIHLYDRIKRGDTGVWTDWKRDTLTDPSPAFSTPLLPPSKTRTTRGWLLPISAALSTHKNVWKPLTAIKNSGLK